MRKKTGNSALDELASLGGNPPGAPVPGAAVGSGCLNGRYATATWLSVDGSNFVTAKLYEWEITYTQDFEDGTAHGDFWDVPIPVKMSWSGEARMYIPASSPGGDHGSAGWNTYMRNNSALYNASTSPATVTGVDPVRTLFTGYLTGTANSNYLLWSGDCYVTRARVSSPRKGVFIQEVSLRGYGPPLYGPFGTPA